MDSKLVALAERLKQQGRDKVMAFWLRQGIDHEHGGYWTDLSRDGSRYGQGEKWIVVQMRNVYGMCLAYQWFGERQFLDYAAQGAAFFRRAFRDQQHGGWYYAVNRDGSEVLDPSKQPYGTAFVSYGLAEYARLSGDKDALQDAIATQDLIMDKCWDKAKGGLPNRFTADWKLVEGIKRVDTHMHTMEGISALYRATGDGRYLERLNLMADTILGRIGVDGCYDAEHGCTHEMFHMDWTEETSFTKGAVNLGHVTEAGWFISKLAAYTGNERHIRLGKSLVDWAIRYGFDHEHGGLYDYAMPTGEVTSDVKTWWNQAELLGALAFLYRQTPEEPYLDLLEKHVAFIEAHQLDNTYGEWYAPLNADGSLRGEPGVADFKGSRWKATYHVIQGLYHASQDLLRAAGVMPVAQPVAWADFCL